MRAPAEPVDLRALCDDVVSRLRESRSLDGVRVSVDGSGCVRGQSHKLRQVVMNLVMNAAEAAGAGGQVAIRIGRSSEGLEVAVGDSGPGVGREARERLFEPFFTTKPTGTGLGLAVSRAIAQAHGGDVLAGTSTLGGAEFTLRIPSGPEGEP